MRSRAFRRHQANRHMWRRLKEDRNQHYEQLDCPCWDDPKAMSRFKEQPNSVAVGAAEISGSLKGQPFRSAATTKETMHE